MARSKSIPERHSIVQLDRELCDAYSMTSSSASDSTDYSFSSTPFCGLSDYYIKVDEQRRFIGMSDDSRVLEDKDSNELVEEHDYE